LLWLESDSLFFGFYLDARHRHIVNGDYNRSQRPLHGHMNQQAKEHNTTKHHICVFNDAQQATYISIYIHASTQVAILTS